MTWIVLTSQYDGSKIMVNLEKIIFMNSTNGEGPGTEVHTKEKYRLVKESVEEIVLLMSGVKK